MLRACYNKKLYCKKIELQTHLILQNKKTNYSQHMLIILHPWKRSSAYADHTTSMKTILNICWESISQALPPAFRAERRVGFKCISWAYAKHMLNLSAPFARGAFVLFDFFPADAVHMLKPYSTFNAFTYGGVQKETNYETQMKWIRAEHQINICQISNTNKLYIYVTFSFFRARNYWCHTFFFTN